MAWLLIISSVIGIWIPSLLKILHGSYSPSKAAFLNDSENGGNAKKRNALLVVAHHMAIRRVHILTFDNYGVSGHYNHRDVHYGVSTYMFRKYSGPVDIWLSIYSLHGSNVLLHCSVNEQPGKRFLAMAQHASQWVWTVWFRGLFVVFSGCTVNTLRNM